MKVKNRLQINVILTTVLVIIVGLIIFTTIQLINDEREEIRMVSRIVKEMTALEIITYKYFLYHEEQTQTQWQLKYDSLSKLLADEQFHIPEEKIILDKIRHNHKNIQTMFRKLIERHNKWQILDEENSTTFRALKDKLIVQLLTELQVMVSNTFQLHEVIDAELLSVELRASVLIVVFLIILILLTVTTSIWVYKSVAIPIVKLEGRIQMIGDGDLTHKVGTDAKDEIGQLSRAFDRMTEDLSKTLVSKEKLEQRVEERTSELQHAKQELEEKARSLELATQAKSRFLANMSHEIRTPLNTIVGFSEILLNQSRHVPLSGNMMQHLQDIWVSSQMLSELVTNVLDLAKIEAGKMAVVEEPLNIKQLFQNIYHINKSKADEKRLTFNYEFDSEIPEWIRSERNKLNRILLNLTENAIKYTPEGMEVRLKAEKKQSIVTPNPEGVHSTSGESFREDFIVFQVIDQGIGISQEYQQRIFDRFEQVDGSMTRLYDGAGLGLAITKQMVELLKGSIEIESHPGKGSIFTVKIPLKETPVQVEERFDFEAQSVSFSQDNIILVVDDNQMNQNMLRAFFQTFNLNIYSEYNGKSALDHIFTLQSEGHTPDLILLDIHMPGIDGIEVARQIHQHPECANIHIVALSADAQTEKKAAAYAEGITEYLTKPIDLKKLFTILTKILRQDVSPSSNLETLPMLPDDIKKQLSEEFKVLSKIPFYQLEEMLDQIEKMLELCGKFNSSYPHLLMKIKRTIAKGEKGREQFDQLIEDILQQS